MLGGVAEAEAAVVDGEDVDACGVQDSEGGEGVGEGAGAIVQIEDGVGGVLCGGCGGWGRCRNVPGGETGLAGLGGVEADGVEGEVECGGRLGDGAGWVKDELPVALIEEQAEGEPGAEERGEQAEAEGFGEPERVDHLDRLVGGVFGVGAVGWFVRRFAGGVGLGRGHWFLRETVAGGFSLFSYEVWGLSYGLERDGDVTRLGKGCNFSF